MSEQLKNYNKKTSTKGTPFWILVSIILYLAICFIGGLAIAVGLSIIIFGAIAWAVVFFTFISATTEIKVKYLNLLTQTKPDSFNVFIPILKKFEKKEEKDKFDLESS